MIRPIEDFMKAAIDRGIRRWGIHNCCACGYPCGYVIESEAVLYDAGCYCSSYGPAPLRPDSWEAMADHYNRNQPENNPKISPEWIAETDAFWGFESELIDGSGGAS